MHYRQESDSIGTLSVPQEAYYGVQSLRGQNNFRITGFRRDTARDVCPEKPTLRIALAPSSYGTVTENGAVTEYLLNTLEDTFCHRGTFGTAELNSGLTDF